MNGNSVNDNCERVTIPLISVWGKAISVKRVYYQYYMTHRWCQKFAECLDFCLWIFKIWSLKHLQPKLQRQQLQQHQHFKHKKLQQQQPAHLLQQHQQEQEQQQRWQFSASSLIFNSQSSQTSKLLSPPNSEYRLGGKKFGGINAFGPIVAWFSMTLRTNLAEKLLA